MSYQSSIDHCDAWDRMYKKYGPYRLAQKVMKTKSYREYIRRYPFDFREPVIPLDEIEINAKIPGPEEHTDQALEMDKLLDSLTDHQKKVFELLQEGRTNSEIEDIMQFNTNSAVRFQKHAIKQKYNQIKDSQLNEYVCRSCAFIYKDKTPLDCPKCGSRDVLNTTVR
jgi:predicted Zn-ribbon and HTH transcriptional regulator